MEFIVVLVVIFGLGYAISALKAFGRAALGKGSVAENLELEFRGMRPFEIRANLMKAGEDGDPFEAIVIEGKGLIPTVVPLQVDFVTSVLDVTGDESKPVLSMIEEFQEPESIAYQHVVEAGTIMPDQGFISWVRIGAVVPEILVPPRSGNRELLVVTRIVDCSQSPQIDLGFVDEDDPAVLVSVAETVRYTFEEPGYEEAAKERDQAQPLIVRLAVAMAMADGVFQDEEAKVIAHWMHKLLSVYSGERRETLKHACNDALKKAHADGQSGTLSVGEIATQLRDLNDDSLKWSAIELAYDVLAADGVAAKAELELVNKVAAFLGLDVDELQNIKDQRIVGLQAGQIGNSDDIETVLGIDPSWPAEQIRRHLASEFRKWNGRINSLMDGPERDNAQHMLNIIAEARKRYG